jgi:hypothetical protein
MLEISSLFRSLNWTYLHTHTHINSLSLSLTHSLTHTHTHTHLLTDALAQIRDDDHLEIFSVKERKGKGLEKSRMFRSKHIVRGETDRQKCRENDFFVI